VHGARSSEPHPLLVSVRTLGESDEEESDQEEDGLANLELRIGALSLAETDDGSLQFFGTRPSPLARRALPAPTLPTASNVVRRATFYLVLKC
jgi:hypothetical protein